jgi:hypothetical protein
LCETKISPQTKERAQNPELKMIESARALRGGLLLVAFWFSIFSACVPALAAANSDAAAAKLVPIIHMAKSKGPQDLKRTGLRTGVNARKKYPARSKRR